MVCGTSLRAVPSRLMRRYYFDLRDEDGDPRPEGMELPDLDAVQLEAACSLVETARDGVREKTLRSPGHQMAIEVRDENGPLLQVKFTFEARRLT
jgi:hypothetical protein